MLLWNCNELSRNCILVCVYILPNTACLSLGFIFSFIIFSLPVVIQSGKKVKMKVLVPRSCPAFCNPVNCSSLGSSVHAVLQARILEWVAISFSKGSFWPRDPTQISPIAGRCFIGWATRENIQYKCGRKAFLEWSL